MTQIHFVRHGEVHNPTDILYGRMPRFRLSERGRGQAQAAATFLKPRPIAAVFSSPMLRARQTAAYIAAPHSLKIQVSTLLNEIHSPYQGKSHAFLEAMDWRMYDNLDEGYERPEDIVSRLQKFIARTRKLYPGQEVVAVTHGDMVLHLQLWARNLPLTHEVRRSIQPYPATASLSTVRFEDSASHPAFEFHVPY